MTGTPEDAERAWAEWADARAAGGSEGSIYIRHRDGTPFHAGWLAGFAARPPVTVDEITELLAGHEWHQPEGYESIWYQSAHSQHQFYYRCAICAGDLEAIASVIVAHITGDGPAAVEVSSGG